MMKPTLLVHVVLRTKKYYLMILGALGLLACIAFVLQHEVIKNRAFAMQNKRSEWMLRELTTIQSQLAEFSHTTTHPEQQSMLTTMQSELSALQQTMLNLAKTADIQKVSNQIASVKEAVDSNMRDIKQTMIGMKGGKQYLDPRALPFQVIAVDIIAGLPYVSVDYNHHVLPLAVGDSLAGWEVMSAYADAGVAEWMNEKNQSVKVVLQN